MKKFVFDKSYEEVEIAGQVYKIDMSDEKVTEYQKAFKLFYEKVQELSNTDIEKISDEEQIGILTKQKDNMKAFTEIVLGVGAFDKLYELSGRSTVNYMQLLMFISEIFEEKTNNIKADARKKYVKKNR